jgi:hypothetical protein
MIPAIPLLDQGVLTTLLSCDPVVQRYRAFFADLDWSVIAERAPTRPWPGPLPHPTRAYVKALLIKLCAHKEYITHLRAFLVDHPLLVLEIGFRPVLDATQPYGFDVERTVPCERWLRHWQQHLDNAVLQALLRPTVQALRAEIPGLGETVAFAVKHMYAWVQAHNPKAAVPDRYHPQRQPTGDPDCRLGVKTSSNQVRADGTTTQRKEYVWGYGSGVVAATDPWYGDVVLAEYTQPFNAVDATYYHPLTRSMSARSPRWAVCPSTSRPMPPLTPGTSTRPVRAMAGSPRCPSTHAVIRRRSACPMAHPCVPPAWP